MQSVLTLTLTLTPPPQGLQPGLRASWEAGGAGPGPAGSAGAPGAGAALEAALPGRHEAAASALALVGRLQPRQAAQDAGGHAHPAERVNAEFFFIILKKKKNYV